MIMPIVLDRLGQTLGAEAQLVLHLLHDLHVDLGQGTHRPEALGLWLVQLVPRVLPDLIHVNSLVWVSYEDLGYEILRIV